MSIFFFSLHAQDPAKLVAKNYNSENGLPQNSAKSVVFDKDGYLWIGTELGLVRNDGSRFKIFNHHNTSQLISDRIVRVGLLNDRSLYCRDEKGYIYRFNAWQQLQRIDGDPELLTGCTNAGLFNLQQLWKQAANKGLEKMMKAHLPGHTIFVTSGDSISGYLLFGYMRYITYLSGYKMQWIDSIDNHGSGSLRIAAYEGQCCYVNNQSGVTMIDTLGKRHQMTIRHAGQKDGVPASSPVVHQLIQVGKKIFSQGDKAIWSLKKIDDNTFWGEPVMNTSDLPDLMSYTDLEPLGIQAAGTSTKGLFIARKNHFQVVRPPAPTSAVMYSQALMPDNAVLTSAGVLPAGSRSLGIPANQINRLSIFRDNRQHYWLIKQAYLCELNEDLKIIRKIHFTMGTIQCFQQTPDGTVWLTVNDYSNHESRLGKIAGDTIIWHHTNRNKMYNESFVALNDHLFWLANKNGLQELNNEKGTIKNFPLFDHADVRSIYKDHKGIIWIGTYGNGFYAMYNGRFVKLPPDRNGYLSSAHTFLEDRKGFMWITTNKGLFQIQMTDLYAYLRDPAIQLYYQYYDQTDGLPTNEFNGGCNPAGLILENGKFSLPSMDGLVQFHPDSITPLLPANKIFIDEVWIDSSRITGFSNCELPASFHRISISVSSPYFGNPYNQFIEYNLKGLDDIWYPLNNDNTIIFNRLKHGKYQLQVRKKAGFGPDNFLITRLNFSVQPGFTDTWTFTFILLVLAGLLIFSIIQLRFRYLVRKKQLLEKEVKARTQEQQRLIEELQAAVGVLESSREEVLYNNRFKEKLALLITHDLQSPLRFLSVMCDRLNAKATGHADHEIRKSSNEIDNAARQIYSFVEEFGLWATAQQENFRIKAACFSPQPLIEELTRFFREMMLSQGNKLVIEIDPEIKLVTDRQLLKIILRNLMDNANKYTAYGIIRIVLEQNGNHATIKVHDSGKGISEKELAKIKQRMEKKSRPGMVDKDSRLGYQIIIEFVSRLGAELSLLSTPGKGTLVTISKIPCEK